jgi:hypothetical protein
MSRGSVPFVGREAVARKARLTPRDPSVSHCLRDDRGRRDSEGTAIALRDADLRKIGLRQSEVVYEQRIRTESESGDGTNHRSSVCGGNPEPIDGVMARPPYAYRERYLGDNLKALGSLGCRQLFGISDAGETGECNRVLKRQHDGGGDNGARPASSTYLVHAGDVLMSRAQELLFKLDGGGRTGRRNSHDMSVAGSAPGYTHVVRKCGS